MSLLRIWSLINEHYGKIVAGVVVALLVGVCWYFGYTPSEVFGWLSK